MTLLQARNRPSQRVQLMGVLNRTPDSFYDGGKYVAADAARVRLLELRDEGADVVDVGAESSRPGAPPVAAAEQIRRLGDLVEFGAGADVVVSVDTTSPEVAEYALGRGARMINSVSMAPAGELGSLCAAHGARLVLTHCRGAMTDMAGFSVYADAEYEDVVSDVRREWLDAARAALDAGLSPDDLVFDPGLGFTKNARQSLELCWRLAEFSSLGHDILVGTSHKSYVARTVAHQLDTGEPPPSARLGGSIVAAVECAARGATMLRVHEVFETRQALAYRAALDALDRSPATGAASVVPRGGEGA